MAWLILAYQQESSSSDKRGEKGKRTHTMAVNPTIPYYAPAEELPAPLPTVEEVLAAKSLSPTRYRPLSSTSASTTLSSGGAGVRTNVQEGLNMLSVAQSTSIPVPKVYAISEHEFEGYPISFIVMEYIPGKTLSSVWKSIDQDKKREMAITLRAYMDELRSLHRSSW
ncbi:uncharacterized protein B0T15DRAFT_531854 [Chaetomium strumarium]|uniref:Aminoglycoside phosphotransferase domain-containing protein n=1 Tax=Chaetomium strumarium TaxID=1170767 RepID=A0AAJ0GSG3_9PEZI|nr:hypothetical protein B0T15DRAFT_531854 [Chaetomium strumarium]